MLFVFVNCRDIPNRCEKLLVIYYDSCRYQTVRHLSRETETAKRKPKRKKKKNDSQETMSNHLKPNKQQQPQHSGIAADYDEEADSFDEQVPYPRFLTYVVMPPPQSRAYLYNECRPPTTLPPSSYVFYQRESCRRVPRSEQQPAEQRRSRQDDGGGGSNRRPRRDQTPGPRIQQPTTPLSAQSSSQRRRTNR